jgi:hypothetical protein
MGVEVLNWLRPHLATCIIKSIYIAQSIAQFALEIDYNSVLVPQQCL